MMLFLTEVVLKWGYVFTLVFFQTQEFYLGFVGVFLYYNTALNPLFMKGPLSVLQKKMFSAKETW